MKFKKIGALILAVGLMLSSMTVMAEESKPTYSTESGNVFETGNGGHSFLGTEEPSASNTGEGCAPKDGDTWMKEEGGTPYKFENGKWSVIVFIDHSASSSSSKSKSKTTKAEPEEPRPLTQQDIADIVSQAETAALQSAAASEGFVDIAQMQKATAKNMSAGEYFNNAVIETPGIEEATPVAQGGGIIIDGVVTNVMATISKVDVAFVDSVRASQEGTVLNVVDVQFPAVAATINFYMPGVDVDANIAAVQYVDGVWVDVEVVEVRADHVVLNLKQNGKVAFIGK